MKDTISQNVIDDKAVSLEFDEAEVKCIFDVRDGEQCITFEEEENDMEEFLAEVICISKNDSLYNKHYLHRIKSTPKLFKTM